jgi:peptidoglycan-associated lipoprotein
MKNRILPLLLGLVAVALVACGGSTTTKPSVEDKSVGTETSGTAAPADVEGKALDGKGKVDLLSKRRVYFAFDSSSVDDQNRAIIEAHAAYLAANKNIKLVLEGHADERGTREYNLALGERRAQAVQRMVKLLGIGADRVKTVSYGEEKPVAMEHDESAWALNRRVEILY